MMDDLSCHAEPRFSRCCPMDSAQIQSLVQQSRGIDNLIIFNGEKKHDQEIQRYCKIIELTFIVISDIITFLLYARICTILIEMISMKCMTCFYE